MPIFWGVNRLNICLVLFTSSSSSYIVSLPNINNISKEEIIKKLWEDDDKDYELDEKIEKIMKKIEEGYNVISCLVPYDEEALELLEQILKEVNGEILIEGE